MTKLDMLKQQYPGYYDVFELVGDPTAASIIYLADVLMFLDNHQEQEPKEDEYDYCPFCKTHSLKFLPDTTPFNHHKKCQKCHAEQRGDTWEVG